MKNKSNTLIAFATAALLPFFAFNAAAEELTLTQTDAQQMRIAAISSIENNLEAMHLDMKEEQNVEIVAMTQLNLKQIDIEVEHELDNNEEYQELIAD